MGLAWPIRSVCAGAAGTAALTAAYAAERRVRRSHEGQLDYDDSLVPGQIVASVMHLPNVTARGDRDLGLALRWGYGSAFGLLHGVLRRGVGEPWGGAAFCAALMTATVTLFPLLGRTPPPWRWPADVMATCLGTHVAYVAGVGAGDEGARRLARARPERLWGGRRRGGRRPSPSRRRRHEPLTWRCAPRALRPDVAMQAFTRFG